MIEAEAHRAGTAALPINVIFAAQNLFVRPLGTSTRHTSPSPVSA